MNGDGRLSAPADRQRDLFLSGLHLALVGYLLGECDDVERLAFHLVHVAFEPRYGVEVVDYVYETVDALLCAFKVCAVDEFVLKASVEQSRNVTLDIENRGFKFVCHIAEILFAEFLGLLEACYLLVVVVGPSGQLCAIRPRRACPSARRVFLSCGRHVRVLSSISV